MDDGELEAFYSIVYYCERKEGVEDFCKYMNYNKRKRKMLKSSDHLFHINHSGCSNYVNVIEQFGPVRIKRKVQYKEQHRELSLSNGFCKSVFTAEGNKLIYVQSGKKEITIVREFFPNHMIMTVGCEKASCKKYFQAKYRGSLSRGV